MSVNEENAASLTGYSTNSRGQLKKLYTRAMCTHIFILAHSSLHNTQKIIFIIYKLLSKGLKLKVSLDHELKISVIRVNYKAVFVLIENEDRLALKNCIL